MMMHVIIIITTIPSLSFPSLASHQNISVTSWVIGNNDFDPSSHHHGSVKNGCISDRIVTFRIPLHFPLKHDATTPNSPSQRLPPPRNNRIRPYDQGLSTIGFLNVLWCLFSSCPSTKKSELLEIHSDRHKCPNAATWNHPGRTGFCGWCFVLFEGCSITLI